MDLRCSRVSDESLDFFGFYPQEFSHRSLYDFLPQDQTDKVSKIHQQLLDNAIHQYKTALPATPRSFSDKFFSASPSELLRIANGSQTLKNKLRFSGKRHIVEVEARFYLGGGLGADLFESDSLEQLYIVCILSESQFYGREQTTLAFDPTLDPLMLQPSSIHPYVLLTTSLPPSLLPITSPSLNTDESIYSLVSFAFIYLFLFIYYSYNIIDIYSKLVFYNSLLIFFFFFFFLIVYYIYRLKKIA
jgi:hypothetical protein